MLLISILVIKLESTYVSKINSMDSADLINRFFKSSLFSFNIFNILDLININTSLKVIESLFLLNRFLLFFITNKSKISIIDTITDYNLDKVNEILDSLKFLKNKEVKTKKIYIIFIC